MKWKGFLILLIAWIIAIPLYTWTANLPNSLDYWLPAATLLLLLIGVTIVYPLILVRKRYEKEIKNGSGDKHFHIKIDKMSLLLALIISIILTLLLLSTYTQTEDGVTRRGILPMIEELFENGGNWVVFTGLYFSMILFCFELIVSYFVISTLRMWRQSKNN